jgi:hypothetical protein
MMLPLSSAVRWRPRPSSTVTAPAAGVRSSTAATRRNRTSPGPIPAKASSCRYTHPCTTPAVIAHTHMRNTRLHLEPDKAVFIHALSRKSALLRNMPAEPAARAFTPRTCCTYQRRTQGKPGRSCLYASEALFNDMVLASEALAG